MSFNTQDKSDNNKRIAKNTIALYIRTFFTMIVGLYTGRVMLQALGVENYGINAVVGGIIAMSSIISGTMSAAVTRYLTYELGKGDKDELRLTFSTSINAQAIMALFIVIILEIVGAWFLNSEANIPDGRMYAANWVLQCSALVLIVELISTPYNALIVAHEKMGIYAYTSIASAILKLGICFVIMAYNGDRLILLSILQVVVSIVMFAFYGWYCGKNFSESRYSPHLFDKKLLKELSVYSAWNLFGNTAWTFNTQGVTMLVNVFFGVTFNAARGVATIVNSAIQGFVSNFTTAFTPQITKSYAAGDIDYSVKLANKGTKYTWLMMYLFLVPVCMEADTLLELWLGQVPEMAPTFLRLSMFESLAVSSGATLLKLIQANGNIKRYQIHVTISGCCVFPLSWIAYMQGAPVWTSYVIFILVYFAINFVRYENLSRLMNFSIREHYISCKIPCIIVSLTSFVVPVLTSMQLAPGIFRFCIIVPLSIISTLCCCFIFGLTSNERSFITNKISTYIHK